MIFGHKIQFLQYMQASLVRHPRSSHTRPLRRSAIGWVWQKLRDELFGLPERQAMVDALVTRG
jgi:hypothetical protein